jgi:hypothetical protein
MTKNKIILVSVVGMLIAGCAGKPAPVLPPNHLIMMTAAPDDSTDASFLSVETLEECEERAATAKAVFPKAGIKYMGHYCTYTDAKFEPFLHNPEPSGPQYIFGLEFAQDGRALKSVSRYVSLEECETSKDRICVISYQGLL